MRKSHNLIAGALLGVGMLRVLGQSPAPLWDQDSPHLLDAGQIVIAGKPTAYVIRHLPVSSFPELPSAVVDLLTQRGCTIPQTFEAHRPENVVHASLERAGSSDWAVLCSVKGTVSLLVFFDGGRGGETVEKPVILVTAPEEQRLQSHDASGVLGFNWGIDPASPQRVHEAQVGMARLPARVDHDALADSIVDRRTIYHFYTKLNLTLLDMPE